MPELRLLTPFDPLVWDRQRFQRFWGWPYRFEAYTPPAKRKLGYVAGRPPRSAAFRRELDAELARVRDFLTVKEPPSL